MIKKSKIAKKLFGNRPSELTSKEIGKYIELTLEEKESICNKCRWNYEKYCVYIDPQCEYSEHKEFCKNYLKNKEKENEKSKNKR